jgi:hypothetical protein
MTAKKAESIKKVIKKKVVKKEEPLIVVTDSETTYSLNWVMIRRKIILFTKFFRNLYNKPEIKKPDKINTDIKKIDLKSADKKLKAGLKND